MKKCSQCQEVKELTEFFKDASVKGGYRSNCKVCKMKTTDAWRVNNRERFNALHRVYNKNNYQKLRMQRYKITPEIYANILAEQKGVCAVCERLPPQKKSLCIDHRHSDGKVRGLLCYKCNRDMSVVDSPEHLQKLLDYAKKNS